MNTNFTTSKKGLSFFILILIVFSACSSRPNIPPRSEVVSEAHSNGIPLPSIDDDRKLFFSQQEDQINRLVNLVSQRGGNEFRDPNYVIGAGDQLEINVFDVEEMNVSVLVRQSGFISLPLLGAVRAIGLTEGEVTDEISKRLTEFMHNPQVSVFIAHYGSQKVSVIGAVQQPGRYSLKKGANSILELLSEAGGVTHKAGNFLNFIPGDLSGVGDAVAANDPGIRAALNPSHIMGSGSQAIEIPLDSVLGTSGARPLALPVRNGDMLIVPEAGNVQVDGEVRKAGTYTLGKRMTLLGALAASGGITYGAKIDEVEVIRSINGRQVHLVLDLSRIGSGEDQDVLLKDGDIVRVPSHDRRRLGQDTFEAVTRIINFGVGGTVNLAN